MNVFNKEFDFVFSIGEDCACAQYLNKYGLRDMSAPFDWLCNASFEMRIQLLCNNFYGFLAKENLKWYPLPKEGLADRKNNIYKDEKLGFNFYHDFAIGLNFEESYSLVKEKYDRRIARLISRLKCTIGNVLIVWWSRDKHLSNETIKWAYNKLSKTFPNLNMHMLICENDMGLKKVVAEEVLENVSKVCGPIVPDVNVTAGDPKVNHCIFSKIRIKKAKRNQSGVLRRVFAKIIASFFWSKKQRRIVRKRIEEFFVPTDDDIELIENKLRFESLINKLKYIESDDERMRLAHYAALIAIETGTGYYSSEKIEQVFLDVGKKKSIPLPTEYDPKTCLIVMSEAYNIGGHTRVVERWVETDSARRYSLVLTRSLVKELPSRLVADIEESGGRIYVLNEDDGWVAKGLELRRLSSKFESVVLHTHMDDPIPLIAFGTDDFKRPVGFFNHADHRFWLGVSVSDIVADFRTWGGRITNTCRRVQDSCLLTIPADFNQICVNSKNGVRKKLGIPLDTKLVLTVGSDFKYKPMLGIDFLDIVIPLLEANPKVVIFGIGMTFDYFPEWERVSRRFNGRLHALGYVAHDKLYDYYAASDLVLDSCPTSGETAMTDAVVCRCPVLGTSNPTGLMEWFVDSVAYCHSVEELLIKAHRILTDEKYALDHVDNVVEKLVANCSEDVFRERLNDFYARLLSLPHSVKMFFSNVVGFSELDKYHLNVNKKRNSHFKIGSFFEVYSERDIRGKQRILELFGRKYSVKKSFCKW